MYQIESKSDLSGAMLVIRFPEKELDIKALYTIQADQPEFLVPFRYRCVDGEAECTYQLGNRGKLLYRCMSRSPEALVGFWERVLQPLLDCEDWFLTPFSFVMDLQYLYVDRDEKTISYLYVPSKTPCSGPEELRALAVDLAEKNPSTDAGTEVKVLRAIMQDFQPKAFLDMLRKEQPAALAQVLASSTAPAPAPAPVRREVREEFRAEPVNEAPAAESEASSREIPQESPELMDGEIRIDLSGGGAKKEKKGLFGPKKEKKKEKKGGLFGKKAEPAKELVLGAAAEPAAVSAAPKWTMAAVALPDEDDGVTMLLEEDGVSSTCFRLAGDSRLPREIAVSLEPGGVFTIGRFDVTIGRRQSNFEFEASTKAVSRHHAAIERLPDGSYTVIDLGSAAGTFLDGQRLRPNVAYRLSRGNRVAFGTAGADYIWEE